MLLDTSGLLCAFGVDQPKHFLAIDLFERAGAKLTHSYILAELTTLARARSYSLAVSLVFAERILSEPSVEVVWMGETLHVSALDLLRNRPDKGYSLCDAVSFVLMRQRRITEALTTDHHFEQEGFVRLL